jgi:hypothetical protein
VSGKYLWRHRRQSDASGPDAGRSFQQTAENLSRAAHLRVSNETLRQLSEQEAKAVLKAQQQGILGPGQSRLAPLLDDSRSHNELAPPGFLARHFWSGSLQSHRSAAYDDRRDELPC